MAWWSAPVGLLMIFIGPMAGLSGSGVALLHDAGLVAVACVLTWVIQHPMDLEPAHLTPLLLLVPICLAVAALLNQHNCSWRFVTLHDICGIAVMVSGSTGAYATIRWIANPPDLCSTQSCSGSSCSPRWSSRGLPFDRCLVRIRHRSGRQELPIDI